MNSGEPKIFKAAVLIGAILLFSNLAYAQSYTQSEQACFDAVQGKVDWNKAGSKQWENAYVRRLCDGTTDPMATISCFRAEIDKHDDWNRAIGACQAKKCGSTVAAIQFGGLSRYYSDGCSCSAVPLEQFGKTEDAKAVFELPLTNKVEAAYVNIDGTDTRYDLLKRVGERQSKSWTEIYESNGSVLKADYVFFKGLGDSAETDEGSVYDITLSILRYGEIGKIEARGICGC